MKRMLPAPSVEGTTNLKRGTWFGRIAPGDSTRYRVGCVGHPCGRQKVHEGSTPRFLGIAGSGRQQNGKDQVERLKVEAVAVNP
jgi:hypothetical protein